MDTNQITYFAETDARSKKIKFGIKAKDRLKHMYVIGKTGMGKSTLLENMAVQDISNGNGLAIIDPHGSFAEKMLDYIPENRIEDVLYFAPFDMEYPISFNVMEDVDADRRHLVVNGLMSTFEKIWADAWSARMSYILQYTIIALLEYPGSTLLGINRMLSDKEYRKKVVDNVTDPATKSFWIDEFGKYTEKFAAEATPAIQNKVGQFTSNPLVRNIIGQSKSSFDVRKMMDEKKILIVNLSKGRVGEGNANLIGSMLITKIYLSAMSRADLSESELSKLPNFYLFVDEFQSFANKSFADILSEARKYKLNLTIAHQYIEQMDEDVRNAVFGNVGTMITFRVGAFDAEVLEKEFFPTFTAEDLVNLGFAQVYLKLMIDGVASRPFSATTIPPIPKSENSFRQRVIESSRKLYARERKDVENEIQNFFDEMKNSSQQNIKKDQRPQQNNQTNQSSVSLNKNIEIKKDNINLDLKNNIISANVNTNQDQPVSSVAVVDKNKEAFLKAKEELMKKMNPVSTGDLSIKPSSDQKDYLPKNEVEQKKVPTQENMKSLKDALSSVLNKNSSLDDKKVDSKNLQPQVENKDNTVKPLITINKPQDIPENNKQIKNNSFEKPKVSAGGVVENEKKVEVVDDKKIQKDDEGTTSVVSEKKDINIVPKKVVKEVPEDVLKNLLSME